MQTTALTLPTMVKQTGALVLLIVIACIPGYGQEIALGILIVTVCGDPAWTLRSLAAGTVVTFVSSPLVSAGGDLSVLVSVLKWLLLFVACGRSLMSHVESTEPYARLIGYWAVITVVLLANSVFVSSLPSISVFKSVGFSLGLLCVIRLAMLTWNRNDEMLLFFAQLGIAVFITSVPLLGSSAGYSKNGSGFNGILNHPQTLGVFVVMTGAAAFAAACKAPRLSRVLIASGLALWSLIFFTGARTALVAIALGGTVYLCETAVRGVKYSRLRYLPAPVVAIAITGLILVVTVSPGLREGFAGFLEKGGQQSLVSVDNPEIALDESSRGGQIFDASQTGGGAPTVWIRFRGRSRF